MSDTKSINWEGPSNWDGSNFWGSETKENQMNLEPNPLSSDVQDLMNDFKGNLDELRKACMKLYTKLTPETGEQLWAVKAIDPLDEIDELITKLYKAIPYGITKGSDGGIIIND